MLNIMCYMLHVTCYVVHVMWYMLHVTCYMLPNNQQGAATSATQVIHPKNSNLERLPLPTFDGTKKNYLRFKKEFSNHVTYTTDKERMLNEEKGYKLHGK